MMNGIDISSYQSDIDLSAIDGLDFVFVKATEGTGYVNPDCSRAVEQALSLGLKVGVYHYCNGLDAYGEAEFFVSTCSNWQGRVLFAIDWESGGNHAWGNEEYAQAVCKRVAELTGSRPVLYASSSAFPWWICDYDPHPLSWVAQYADYEPTGWQESPWNEGAYACDFRQYTSTGRLSGYVSVLDLNKSYITAGQWDEAIGADEMSWDEEIDGFNGNVKARDRLAGIDEAVNEIRQRMIYPHTSAVEGDESFGGTVDRIDYIDNRVATLSALKSVTPEQEGTDMPTRLAYMALRQNEILDAIAALSAKVDELERKCTC